MAKRKTPKQRKGKVPPHLRKYLFKKKRRAKSRGGKSKRSHHRKGTHVAKRKHSKRRSGGGKRRGSHRRRHHSGFGGGYQQDIETIIAGGIFGAVEKKMKSDDSFFLNKVPSPIDALGRTGNLSLALYLGSYLAPGKFKHYLRRAARTGAGITSYQLMRKGEAFKSGNEFFTISGPDGDDEHMLGDDDLGELEEEVGRRWNVDASIDDGEGEHAPPHPDEVHAE